MQTNINTSLWPKKNDRLFVQDSRSMCIADTHFCSCTDYNNHFCSGIMAGGYFRAAEILIECANIRKIDCQKYRTNDVAILTYPIIFNYRHYLELEMKSLLAGLGFPNWRSHSLMGLWKELARVIESKDNSWDIFKQHLPLIVRHIKKMDNIDPYSDCFRYPVDKHGNRIVSQKQSKKGNEIIDCYESIERYPIDGASLLNLKRVMGRINAFFCDINMKIFDEEI